MNIILLSGGSGKRLWPLSNDVRSKQFIKIFNTENGKESMAQRMFNMINEVDNDANIIIATTSNQVPIIKNQLGENVQISIEPSGRNTFPAIALACAYAHEQGAELDEAVVICPVDSYVDKSYYSKLKELSDTVKFTDSNIVLMGINPTYPSEKYGYIIPEGNRVKHFKEKPDSLTAQEYIKQGALWNSGVFAFRISYILDIAEQQLGTSSYSNLLNIYENLPNISFDYAVVEKEKNISFVRYSGTWEDLGTWNTFSQAMSEDTSGNANAYCCNNTHIVNELSVPIIALGINDAIISATPDGILVADKELSTKLKEFVKPQRPMFEVRTWGEYKVLDYNSYDNGLKSLTKHLIVKKDHHISYQIHRHRTEMWTFLDGTGDLIINGVVSHVKCGDSIVIKEGTKHAIKATKDLHIIEVQIGDIISESDIERLEFDWNNYTEIL